MKKMILLDLMTNMVSRKELLAIQKDEAKIKLSSANDSKSAAIANDSRHYSDIFAEEAALVLAANNIKAYVFDSLRATPDLTFAVRHLKCDAGIVITASHNPPEYIGYKVYGSDGGQITLNMANAIISEINKIEIFEDVKTCDKEDALKREMLLYNGTEPKLKVYYSARGNAPSISSKKINEIKQLVMSFLVGGVEN